MDLELFVLRVVVGLVFAAHGAQNLFGAFSADVLDGTAGFFDQVGLRPGRLYAAGAGACELGGGLLLAIGLVTPFAAAALIAVMTAAVLTVHIRNGFFVTRDGFEYNLTLVAALFALAGVGTGRWSLDHALSLDLAGAGWTLAALAAGVLGGVLAVLGGRLGVDHRQPDAA